MATTADEASIPARLFGEHLPATGVDAKLTMLDERIEVTSEHHTLSRRIAASSDVKELTRTQRKRKLTELSQRHAGTFEPQNSVNWPPTEPTSSPNESALEVEQ